MNKDMAKNIEALKKRHANALNRWELKDQMSKKNGPHSMLYMTNGDNYHGEWKNDLKDGNGTYHYHKSGNVYEGQWSLDKRSGYGTLSIRVKEEAQKPTTDVNSFILDLERQKKSKKDATSNPLRKVYAGQWANDKRHGLGTCFYENGDVYHGHWEYDMKEGWGQMQYVDGSVYEGEFHQEKRHGQGILLLANGDRYEGMWFNDHKEGPGKFIYRGKRQIYEGEWALGLPKCGTLKDLPPIAGNLPRTYPIPKIQLEDPAAVIDSERKIILEERVQRLIVSGN